MFSRFFTFQSHPLAFQNSIFSIKKKKQMQILILQKIVNFMVWIKMLMYFSLSLTAIQDDVNYVLTLTLL